MKTLFLLCFGFVGIKLTAQTVAFAADKMNVLYIGVENPITIVVENLNCKDLKAITNNGKIIGKGCKLVIIPEKIGTASITVQTKKNKWSVATFRVKETPLPQFKIGSGGGRMPIIVLQNQQYVRAGHESIYFEERVEIDSFTVCAFLKDSCIFNEVKNIGSKISQEVSQLFAKLKPEDTILFKYIYARRNNEESINLEPIMVTVY